MCGVLGHLAPVHGVHTWRVVLCLRCPGHLGPDHRCAPSVRCVACAVSWATWLLFTGVIARCDMFCVRCPGQLGSCSALCSLSALRCVCGVLGHLASVHRCARPVRCVACAVSWATWPLFTAVRSRCVVFCVQCSGPLCSFSPMCPLGALCSVCGVLGHLAPVHRCARSVRCVACAMSLANQLLCTGVHARHGALGVRCPGPLGSCSALCWLGVLCCVCGVQGHLAPVHRCARLVRCVACAVSLATWLLFTGVHARRVVLRVRCPRPRGACSVVCSLGALCCVVVFRPTRLLCTGVNARHVVLRVPCPGPLGFCSPCARSVRCVA